MPHQNVHHIATSRMTYRLRYGDTFVEVIETVCPWDVDRSATPQVPQVVHTFHSRYEICFQSNPCQSPKQGYRLSFLYILTGVREMSLR